MTQIKTRLYTDGPFEINDKIAGIVPMANTKEQEALKVDISINGQKEPITLWKNQIIDGRCRQKALVELKKDILYRELDNSLTEEEVKAYVKALNTRRNLTLTQKTISAYKLSLEKNSPSLHILAKSWGISEKTLKFARYIGAHRPEYIEPLFNGDSILIKNSKEEEIYSNKVSAIYAYIKRTIENVQENTDYKDREVHAIKTQAGKDWYNEIIEMFNIKDTIIRMLIVELANYKFAEKDNNTKNIIEYNI